MKRSSTEPFIYGMNITKESFINKGKAVSGAAPPRDVTRLEVDANSLALTSELASQTAQEKLYNDLCQALRQANGRRLKTRAQGSLCLTG
jgi:hypothetical protein